MNISKPLDDTVLLNPPDALRMIQVSPNNEKVNNFTPETLSIFQSELSCFNVHSE